MKTLFFALVVALLMGCTGIKPVGPFAKDVPIVQQGRPLTNATPAPAIRPTPPTMLIAADDVNMDKPYEAANKLTSELGTDSKVTPNVPVTVEVSRIKRK